MKFDRSAAVDIRTRCRYITLLFARRHEQARSVTHVERRYDSCAGVLEVEVRRPIRLLPRRHALRSFAASLSLSITAPCSCRYRASDPCCQLSHEQTKRKHCTFISSFLMMTGLSRTGTRPAPTSCFDHRGCRKSITFTHRHLVLSWDTICRTSQWLCTSLVQASCWPSW